MAYDQMSGPEEMGGGAMMRRGGGGPPASEEENTISVDAASFPQGIDLKEGAKVTFCVTSPPDSEGMVSGYFEGGEPVEEGTSWEDDFRAEMSPQNQTEEAE